MLVSENMTIISQAVAQALETMAFMTAMPADEQLEQPTTVITTEIDFSGPSSGTITAAVGSELATCLAQNISGLDELSQEHCIDVMKELVNVTCGLVLPMIAESEADVFDMTVPHLSCSEDSDKWQQFVSQEDITLMDVEGWPLAIKLTMTK